MRTEMEQDMAGHWP